MNRNVSARCFAVIAMFPFAASHGIEPDMPGSADFPDMPRVEGTHIVGYQQSQFDSGTFLSEVTDRKPGLVHPEGKRTRIVYLGQDDQSTIQLLRNYKKAFVDFGNYTETYVCSGQDCPPSLVTGMVWTESNRVPVSFRNAYSLYILSNQYRDPSYVYGTILKDDSLYHVSVFTTFVLNGQAGIVNKPIVHLEILEIEEFEPTLQFVNAEEIVGQISEVGSIALYGIQFDYDSARLTAESGETIAEIAKALSNSPDLNVYVVGHTDNQGSLAYNQGLSTERANSVVESLVKEYGIADERLVAAGVGPVAPAASNSTDEGRQLNRRVEIVEQ